MNTTRTPPLEERPQVSILMTVYNTAQYLDDAIHSILRQQTARTWELIIVDDGSTDGSLLSARDYASRYPQCVRVLQHRGAANRGISASRNLALGSARAPLLAFLDSDDVWLPNHLDTLADLLDALPKVQMVYAGAERWVHPELAFHEGTARAATWGDNYLPPLVPPGQKTGLLPLGQLLEWIKREDSFVPCICSVMVRTAAARQVGGFCDEFRGLYDDQTFHTRMATRFPIYALDTCVARYRQHAASCCARARADQSISRTERDRFHQFLREHEHTETLAPA